MAYDRELDERIRAEVAGWKRAESKNMFEGVCHLMNGNMFSGVYREYLVLRLGEREAERALTSPDARPFDIIGRPMKGWVMVDRDGYEDEDALRDWLAKARRFVETLPPK